MRRLLFLIVLLISVNDISAQWLEGYCYRKGITIQESQIPDGSDFMDFPVLINIAFDADLKDVANGGYVNNSDGWDLVFTASDGTTLLDHDVEHYDETSGEYVAWVKIPMLDHDDNTVIYLYFGYDTPLADPTKSTTWSNGFVSVYHLHDDFLDALSSNNGTNFGSVNAIGRVADGQDFEYDNSTDRIEIGNFDVSNDSITISAWIRPESFDNTEARIVSKASSIAEQDHYWMLSTITDGTALRFRLRTGANTVTHFSGTGILSTGSWQYVAAVYNGANMNLFHNGSQVGTPLIKSGSINTNSSVDVAIGNQPASASDWATQKKHFDGIIDEVRIVSAARSSDWLTVEYNNLSDPGSFYIVSAIDDNIPVASAGPDQDLCGVLLATLAGDATIGLGTWTQISGPGTITFGDININNTSSTADSYGTYVLRWTVVNGTCNTQDEVAINYAEASVAGPDQDLCGVLLATLAGNAPTIGVGTWTQISGPGTITFGDINVNNTSSTADGNGTYVLRWTIDNNGSCSTLDEVLISYDAVDPVILCPGDLNAVCDISEAPAYADYASFSTAGGSATDNCSIDPVSFTLLSELSAGLSCPDTVTRTYQIADTNGNTATCQQDIVIDDTIDPTASNPASVNVQCIGDVPIPDITVVTDEADNCTATPVVAFVSDVPEGTCPIVITRTYSVSDDCGNSVNIVHIINVEDSLDPTFDTNPGNLTAVCDITEQPAYADYAAFVAAGGSASDNCGIDAASFTLESEISDELSSPETVTRTYTIADLCGNTGTYTQEIVLTDDEEPEIICPGAITEYLDESCEFILPDYISAVSIQDNCDQDPFVTQSPPPGTLVSGSGTVQEIKLSARDGAGYESECVFDVMLLDNTPPEAFSIRDTSVVVEEGDFSSFVSIPVPDFTDNCGIQSVVNDFNGGDDASGIFPYGTTTVTYTVTDINNNSAQFNQQVLVGLEIEPEHGLVIPEAFSPNEDGLNDRFEILGLEKYPQNELRVFNVHGLAVFTMENYDNSWDGTPTGNLDSGNKLPTGTYYYVLHLELEDAVVKGFVYIRRE